MGDVNVEISKAYTYAKPGEKWVVMDKVFQL